MPRGALLPLVGAALALALVACVPHNPDAGDPGPPESWKTDDGRHQIQLEVAASLLDKGQAPQADIVLAELAKDPKADQGELHLLQGRSMWMQGLYSQAEPLLTKAREEMPKDARPLRYLGLVYADQNKTDDAVATLKKAVALDDKDAASWNNLGFLELSQKQYEDARAALETAVALDATNPRYRTNLGFALAALGDGPDALQAFRSVGSEADAQANLGLAYELTGDDADALIHYQKALDANPSQAQAKEGLDRLKTPETP